MNAETKYARSGELWIAYQVLGESAVDLVWVPGYLTHVEQNREWPAYARFLDRLASFSRVIAFDRRGTGLSDRILGLGSFEEMMDDIRTVMDAARSQRAVLFGGGEGGPMCMLFAATFPERTTALVLHETYPRRRWAPDYPWGVTEERERQIVAMYENRWGQGSLGLRGIAPSLVDDESFKEWYGRAQRFSATPGSAIAWHRLTMEIDVRHVLPAIRVPTLVIHRSGDRVIPVEAGRYLAEHIPAAKYVELPGSDHFSFVGDSEEFLGEVEEFVTGSRRTPDEDRVLATVLFTDIVGSTERAAELGDRRWADFIDAYRSRVRSELLRFRGKEIDTAGDGFLATFDGPARGIRCAQAICQAARGLGTEIRVGLHTGEIELLAQGIGGIAVHIGARIAALARPGEAWVSSTVKDLVVGAGIDFVDRGAHALKGVPGQWQLYSAVNSAQRP